MSLISKIFSGEKACSLHPEPISVATLKQLIPIRNINEDELTAYTQDNQSEVHAAKTILFKGGEQDSSILYLLEGRVRVDVEGGESYEIEAESAKANFPLSTGRKHSGTAIALSDVRVLRVSNRIMGSTSPTKTTLDFADQINALEIPEEVKSSRLLESFCQYYGQEHPSLPTMPDIATRLRKALANDVPIDKVVDIVQLDPAIATKLIQVANCPLYVATKPVTSCRDAVIRLGLNATRTLVTSITLKQLFTCNKIPIKQKARLAWQQSVNLSCLCFVLASESASVNPEDALLAGLICDIGMIPFLQFVDNFPTEFYEPDEIDLIAPYICGPAGHFLLKKWDFSEELILIPQESQNWYYDSSDKLNLTDVVILSKLHSYIGTPSMAKLPPINSIPACSKLPDGTLSPEHSLNVLHLAKDRVKEAFSIFD